MVTACRSANRNNQKFQTTPVNSFVREMPRTPERWLGSLVVSPGVVLCRSADLSTLVQAGSKKRVFVSSNQISTENLLKAGMAFSLGGRRMGELLCWNRRGPRAFRLCLASSIA
jgi:hypothetical protein